jgi:hypothetical protein
MVYCRDSGRMRFLRGPFDALLVRTAAVICLPVAIRNPDLPNGPSAGAHDIGLRRAVENCRRALMGETPLHVIGADERLM